MKHFVNIYVLYHERCTKVNMVEGFEVLNLRYLNIYILFMYVVSCVFYVEQSTREIPHRFKRLNNTINDITAHSHLNKYIEEGQNKR